MFPKNCFPSSRGGRNTSAFIFTPRKVIDTALILAQQHQLSTKQKAALRAALTQPELFTSGSAAVAAGQCDHPSGQLGAVRRVFRTTPNRSGTDHSAVAAEASAPVVCFLRNSRFLLVEHYRLPILSESFKKKSPHCCGLFRNRLPRGWWLTRRPAWTRHRMNGRNPDINHPASPDPSAPESAWCMTPSSPVLACPSPLGIGSCASGSHRSCAPATDASARLRGRRVHLPGR